eukprot:364867-Chlamydomonas_euryale.AAC.7
MTFAVAHLLLGGMWRPQDATDSELAKSCQLRPPSAPPTSTSATHHPRPHFGQVHGAALDATCSRAAASKEAYARWVKSCVLKAIHPGSCPDRMPVLC